MVLVSIDVVGDELLNAVELMEVPLIAIGLLGPNVRRVKAIHT